VIAHPSVVVVTGASGFIGRHLIAALIRRGYLVRVVIRQRGSPFQDHSAIEICEVRDIVDAPWGELLAGAEAVVHLAGIAHRANPGSAQDAQRLRAVNVEAVADLTRGAAAARVRRMLLLSSIGVLGATSGATAFDEASIPAPHDFYSRTKLDAERAAADASAGSLLQLCVVRAPLVFGPAAPGNFGRLVACIRRGIPLPLGAIDNRRSLVFIDNLVDLTITAALHPAAAGGVWLVRDDIDLSTPCLVRALAGGFGRPARMFAVPRTAWSLIQAVPGLGSRLAPLTASLQVDDATTRAALDWSPPVPAMSGLALTARSVALGEANRGSERGVGLPGGES